MYIYSFKSTIIGDRWAIDSTVAKFGDSWYIFFSAFSTNNLQSIFAAKLANPFTVDGNYSLISEPTLDWEKKGMPMNEGTAVLQNGSHAWMTYSASYCGTDGYSLGLLTWTGGDPLSASSWTKNTAGPVFSNANNDFGPGHNGFFTSPDGSTSYNVYHASQSSEVKCVAPFLSLFLGTPTVRRISGSRDRYQRRFPYHQVTVRRILPYNRNSRERRNAA